MSKRKKKPQHTPTPSNNINKYDRIFKENFADPTEGIIRTVLKIHPVQHLPLPSQLHRTLEREMDGFWKANVEPPYLIDIEWMTTNDPSMPQRMLLYHALGAITYRLPVIGFVIYVGEAPLTMPSEIQQPDLQFRYQIINMHDSNPEDFLQSDLPQDVLLAVLAGKTKGEEKRPIVQKVLAKLQVLLKDNLSELGRRLEQLEVLAELRNIQNIIIEEEQHMKFVDAILSEYDITKDIRYQQGRQQGAEKERREKNIAFVKKLLVKGDYNVEEIADLADVSVDFVLQIKNSLLNG